MKAAMQRYHDLLFHLLSFESLWAYFYLSDGKLHHQECCDVTGMMGGKLRQLAAEDPALLDPEALKLPEGLAPAAILQFFSNWDSNTCDSYEDFNFLLQNSHNIRVFVTALKAHLCERLGISLPLASPDERESMFRESIIRWQAHFPTDFLLDMSKAAEMLEWASSTDSIVVVGDIRRSQDLMTYARDNQSFTENIFKFIEKTRCLIHQNMGLFDKFTGDGFLAYFNETLCALKGKDFKTCFLDFVREEIAFAREHFPAWCLTVRKIPEVEVGLCIGADIGMVNFQDVNSHLIAVGDSIIWANRMCSAGSAGEIVVNNLLYAELQGVEGLDFASLAGRTKSGETFTARRLAFAHGADDSEN